MAQTIACFAARIKRHYGQLLPETVIVQSCRTVSHRWRERKFTPVVTIWLFVLQVLHGNTAILHLRHLIGTPVNAAAYCKARLRLPLAMFELLLEYSAAQAAAGCKPLWQGMRILLADCTSTLAPDTPSVRKAFRQSANIKPGCGYPMAKVLAFFDAASGAILQPFICALYVHEASKVWKLHPLLLAGDLLVADRAFCSFVHLAMLAARGVFGCLRVQQKQKVDFRRGRKHGGKGQAKSRWIKKLGREDQLVEWLRPQQRPKWMTPKQFESLPQGLVVRELRYHLSAKGQRTREVTVVTTLLDPKRYPAEKIAELYGLRWQVETYFAHVKTTMKMAHLKCRSADGVKKELLMYFITYNLIRCVIRQAADRQQLPPRRISFIDAMRWLANARWRDQLIVLVVIPLRPDRHEPRVKKYLKYRYRSMTKPRHILRKRPYLYADKVK